MMGSEIAKNRRVERDPVPAPWALPAAGAVVLGLGLLMVGCSQANSTRLPELASIPRKILSGEEQKKAVEELQKRRETHQAEAIEKIKDASR